MFINFYQRKLKFFNSIGKYFQTKSTTTCIDPRYLRKFISVPAQIMKHKQQLNRYLIFCKIYNSCQTSEISSDYDIFL